MDHGSRIIGVISGLTCMISSVGMAAGVIENPAVEDKALILHEYDRLYIETPVAADLAVMNVRVFNGDNELVLNVRSFGEPIEFMVNNGLPDGDYSYETVSIFTTRDLSKRSEAQPGTEASMVRHFGSFKVSNGQIDGEPEQQNLNAVQEDASLLDKVIRGAVNLAGVTLDLLIPAAQADTFTSVVIESGNPEIWFDDTATTSGIDWIISSNVDGTDDAGWFKIESWINGNSQDVFRIDSDGTTNNENSINVDPDGDIHWANSRLNLDRGLSALSLGTTSVRRDVTISSMDPAVDLFDETFADSMGIHYDGFWFNIYNEVGSNSARLAYNAPADSFVINGTGTSGFGGKIHVGSTTDPVGQFTITSSAQPRFEMNDTTLGKRWRFSVANDKFAINQLDVAGTEFQVFETGDMLIGGTLTENSDVNAKQDIVPVDRHEVLAKITQLPIAEWSYKDTTNQRHIGPMAQDFHAAFGLGRNNKGISTLDSSGVALAGIQALADENAAIRTQFESVRSQNEALLEQNAELSDRLAVLERQQAETQAVMARMLEAQLAEPVLTRTLAN